MAAVKASSPQAGMSRGEVRSSLLLLPRSWPKHGHGARGNIAMSLSEIVSPFLVALADIAPVRRVRRHGAEG